MEFTLLHSTKFLLAECPVWSVERNSLLWVDIEGKTVNEWNWNSRQLKIISLPYQVSFLVEAGQDRLIVGLRGGLAFLDLESKELTWIERIEKKQKNMRCNDGKCDAWGRLWFGTMDMESKQGIGAFYLYDQQQGLHKKLKGLGIPNGLTWSLNNDILYHIDSTSRNIKSYKFDLQKGNIIYEKVTIQVPEVMGLPDGMTVDEEGMLWVAHWGGFGVCRWNPSTGELLTKIELPVPHISSCTFGGEGFEYLFITSACKSLSKEEQERYPLSGSIFVVKPGIKGFPSNKFRSS